MSAITPTHQTPQMDPSMEIRNGKVRIQKLPPTTPVRDVNSLPNRDALALMSDDDRNRLAGQSAVVARKGKLSGTVMGHGATWVEAAKMAQLRPDYRPMDCVVIQVYPPGEHPCDHLRPTKASSEQA